MFSVMVCRIVTVISAEMSQYSLSMYIDTVRSLYNDMNGQDKQSGQQGTSSVRLRPLMKERMEETVLSIRGLREQVYIHAGEYAE